MPVRRQSYVARIRLDERDAVSRIENFRPLPGMPADVYIETGERTFFHYIMRPLLDSSSRAFRESQESCGTPLIRQCIRFKDAVVSCERRLALTSPRNDPRWRRAPGRPLNKAPFASSPPAPRPGAAHSAQLPSGSKFRPESLISTLFATKQGGSMKLVIGKPDGSEVAIAEEARGEWKPSPNLTAQLEAFLKGANPEDFEMWVEEDE
jgi:hypothetical protein